jgi:hypothetical protein
MKAYLRAIRIGSAIAMAIITEGLARSQGISPASVSGITVLIIITNGTGYFASSGAMRITLDRTGTIYVGTPLTPTVAATAGTYTWEKTGPSTARMTMTELGSRTPITYSLAFTTQTSANYGFSNSFGASSGLIVLENGSLTPTPGGAGLANMSVRATVPQGGQIIPGIVIDAPTRVLVRVAGPALAAFGVSGTLPNPKVALMSGSTTLASNDDWSSTTSNQMTAQDAATKTGAFGFSPGSRDAALVMDLNIGAYTCMITGDPGTSGEVLLEVYRIP